MSTWVPSSRVTVRTVYSLSSLSAPGSPQIMTFKKLGKQALALSLAVLMAVFGCAFVLGPARASSAADAKNETQTPYETINVSTADEFISAIGSNRRIVLAPGTYDLSGTAGYGTAQGADYYWEYTYDDGYSLVLDVVNNLAGRRNVHTDRL